MDAKQEAKLNMYRVVEQYCDDNSAIVSTVIAFQTAFTNFKAKIALLVGSEQLSALPIKGIAVDKTVSKQDLSQLAADVASLISAFAAATSNNTLLEEVNFPYSKLFGTRDDLLAPRCQNIYDAGVANMPAVKDYGLTQAALDALQAAITNYAAQTPKPRSAVSQRKIHNANIKALFVDADAILKSQMDKMIVAFRAANPDFVTGYDSNRIIIDPATTTTKITGIVTGIADEKPIKDAQITATGTAGGATGVTKSTVTTGTGKYTLKPLPPGDYTITVEAPGFQPFEETQVHATMGNNNHLDVGMENV